MMGIQIRHILLTIILTSLIGCGGSESNETPPENENNGNNNNSEPVYGEIGEFKDAVSFYKDDTDKYIVYSPTGHLDNAPIVLFLPGGNVNISRYSGLMKFIASHGYFVIGTQVSNEYSDHSSNISFDKALAVAKQHHAELDFGKLIVMGHSQGGGLAFPVMKHMLDAGEYGTDSNLVISLDGWFAFGMDQQNIRSLTTNAAFMQFGGKQGTGTDPRINLTILNLMPNTNEKSYLLLAQNRHHSYASGTLNEIITRTDLLKPIHALLEYNRNNTESARNIVFHAYENTLESVSNTLKDKNTYSGDCEGNSYNAKATIENNDIDYCVPDEY